MFKVFTLVAAAGLLFLVFFIAWSVIAFLLTMDSDMAVLFGVLAVIFMLAGIAAAGWRVARTLFAVMLLAVVATGCTRVGPGYAGIKVNMAGTNRGVDAFPVKTGWVFYNPISEDVLEWPVFVQNVNWQNEEAITFSTKDKMQINVDISMAYSQQFEKVPAFYVKFRTDDMDAFTHGYLHSLTRDKFNLVGGNYNIDQIMGGHAQFIDEVRKALQADLEPYGIRIESQFGIIGAPRPPKTVIDSINASVQASQFAVQKQNELVQVQADAAKQVAQAKGEAEALLTRARAEAEANLVVARSLTPELIQWRTNSKWNGQLPQVTGGSGLIMQLPVAR